ncbi:reverse transcriptase domain-containing protein [Nostoc punctiforme UO1]|uniref:group II intron reverse transcriptase n=1 Tax=Nostoc punctiforme TaxID=272131 RepID=UPI00309F3117
MGSFDKINHEVLLQKLNTYPTMKRLIRSWLKAGVVEKGQYSTTSSGTPQGGVISPLLANIALHGIEERVFEEFPKDMNRESRETWYHNKGTIFKKPQLIRYADDFVVLHENEAVITRCQEIITEWLGDMGLELKPSKTKIVHTLEGLTPGFDFLGFNIRQFRVGKTHSKQGFKTIITPSKSTTKAHYDELAAIIDRCQAVSQDDLIRQLNPVISGWVNYYSTVCSKETFGRLDFLMWNRLRRWGYRRHPNKSRVWVVKKYWRSHKEDNWTFSSKEVRLLKHRSTEIVRHVKVRGTASPFDGNLIYWSQRMSKHPQMPKQKAKLLKAQKGKCSYCGLTFRDGDIMEVHHRTHRAQDGNNKTDNLGLLHLHCHDQVHGTYAKGSYIEEPDEVKISRPVLKTSQFGDKLA